MTSELFGILGLDVATMVLVEVVQLVVDVNRWFNCFVDLQRERAGFGCIFSTLRQFIVLHGNLLDLATHDVYDNT